jgi:hypothetical protein
MNRISRASLVLLLTVLVSACAMATRSPRISELRANPARYQNHSVNISGVVTSSWGVPLVPYRMYKVDDGSGEVTVLSQSTHMPTRGAHVRVKGKVEDIAVLGGQSLGLHLREESLSVKGN